MSAEIHYNENCDCPFCIKKQITDACKGHKLLSRDPKEHNEETRIMLSGGMYLPTDPVLLDARAAVRLLCQLYSTMKDISRSALRQAILKEILHDKGDNVFFEGPLFMDYGRNTSIGAGCYFNTECVILDVNKVTIGCGVFFAPGVNVYTATHPTNIAERLSGRELGKPVVIEDGVWVGGRAVICPGVTIGTCSVIGAGCVVPKDIPPASIVVGNPARVVKRTDLLPEPKWIEWRENSKKEEKKAQDEFAAIKHIDP